MILCFILPITFIFGNGESSDIKFEKVIDSLKTLRNRSPERAIRYAREILDDHGSNDLGHNESRILNTCLLYTSPSPRDRQKSRMPSSA